MIEYLNLEIIGMFIVGMLALMLLAGCDTQDIIDCRKHSEEMDIKWNNKIPINQVEMDEEINDLIVGGCEQITAVRLRKVLINMQKKQSSYAK